MKNIIYGNVKCKNPNDRLKLIIYYKSATVKSLASRNNNPPSTPPLHMTDLIYEFNCNKDECEHLPNNSYIGLTTTTLSRTLTMHLNSGGPKTHMETQHNEPLTRNILENGTKILRRETDHNRLKILEALLIQEKQPEINQQITGSCRTLLLHCERRAPFQRAQLGTNAQTPTNGSNEAGTNSNRFRRADLSPHTSPVPPPTDAAPRSPPYYTPPGSPLFDPPSVPSSMVILRRSQRIRDRNNR